MPSHAQTKWIIGTAFFLVIVLDFALAGCKCTIAASDYDQSCRSASDCVAVPSGDFCGPRCTNCPNAAININAEAQYESDLSKVVSHPYLCPCSSPPDPQCHNGICEIPSLASSEAGSD